MARLVLPARGSRLRADGEVVLPLPLEPPPRHRPPVRTRMHRRDLPRVNRVAAHPMDARNGEPGTGNGEFQIRIRHSPFPVPRFVRLKVERARRYPRSAATISAAARVPVVIAPCTVPGSPTVSVASPAKNKRPAIGAASAAGASSPPTGIQL